MAKLVHLDISGIRGFAPDDTKSQRINFGKPLTLILGRNGCGKTTLIEALNYACCGEILGSKRDFQDFVNDPRTTCSHSSKGKINLQLLDGTGNTITVTKRMEVEVNADATQPNRFKGKPANMTVVDGAGDVSAPEDGDVTKKLCEIMKVSPSVLNNVVFCHQENSNWPFMEGGRLKERFDDIFETEKYRECIKSFKDVYKEKESRVKLLKQQLSGARDKKRHIESQQKVLKEKESYFESLENKIQLFQDELDSLKKKLEEITELKKTLDNCKEQLMIKEVRKDRVMEEQTAIRRVIKEVFEGGDEELENKIKNFEQDRQKDENAMKELEKNKLLIEGDITLIKEKSEEIQSVLNKLNEEKKEYLDKNDKRKELIQKVKEEMDLKMVADCSSHEGAILALKELKVALDSLQNDIDGWSEEVEAEETRLQGDVDKIKENLIRTEENIEFKKEEIKNCKEKLIIVCEDLTKLNVNEELKIENIEDMINKLNKGFNEDEETIKLENYKKNLLENESLQTSLEKQLKILHGKDKIEGRLENEKMNIENKEKEISCIKIKNLDKLKQLFGEEIPKKNFSSAIESLQQSTEKKLESIRKETDDKQKEIILLELNLLHYEDQISDCKNAIKEKNERISKICNGRNFEDALKCSLLKKTRLQQERGECNAQETLFKKYIKAFEKEAPCCPVCETDFSINKDEIVNNIIANLKSELEVLPQKLEVIEEELKMEEKFYDYLQQHVPINDELTVMVNETLPSLNKKLNETERNLMKEKSDFEYMKMQANGPQEVQEIVKKILPDFISLDQKVVDVKKSKKSIEKLQNKLVYVEKKKSKQDLEIEIDRVKAEIKEHKEKIDLQNGKINDFKENTRYLHEKKKKLIESTEKRNVLKKEEDDLSNKITKLENEIINLNYNLTQINAELNTATHRKESIVTINKQQVLQEMKKITLHKNTVDEIEKLEKEINDYIKENTDNKITANEHQLKEYKINETVLKISKEETLQQIYEKKKQLDTKELQFRILEDNVILRDKIALAEKLQVEIQTLIEKIGENDIRIKCEEQKELSEKIQVLNKQIDTLTGEKTTLLTRIEELKTDLNKTDSKQALKNYFLKYYQVKIAESVIYDLYKYIDALERANFEFYQTKMTEINKHLRQLWHEIYRGNDIDYIEIKSVMPINNTKKKSYCYKIVQVKNGTEQDMRKRCSAGQKILASLIIRLALAEALSINCGIFTLDEPTTNLDKENNQSLSEALSRMVQIKSENKNFQLLVITHDEDFARTLTRNQDAAKIYRISRDRGFSVINEESVI